MTKKRIYLDHSATTPLRSEVLEAMQPCLTAVYGNPSSVHGFGQEAKKALEDARARIAELLHAAKPEEIIFTAGGTEADNLALKGVVAANRERGNHIITTEIEHHAVLYTAEFLEKNGCNVTYLPVDSNGRVNPEDLRKAMTPKTILISVMHANNEVGTIQPIADIAAIVQEENARRSGQGAAKLYLHTDAVQTAGKLPIDVQALGVDLLSLSAHKFYGPKGVGLLYIKRGTRIHPQLHGGHHERNLRAGTENLAGIVGMAAALALAAGEQEQEQGRLARLRYIFEQGVAEQVGHVRINAQGAERIAGVSSISFEFIEGESLLLSLDLEGVAASTGSACASGSLESSHVLKAMCVDPATAQGTLRFSFGHQSTEEQIARVLELLPRLVTRLRNMSPLWKGQQKKQS